MFSSNSFDMMKNLNQSSINGLELKVVLVLTQPCADSFVVITAQESALPIAEH